jgi:rare lipoprotein A
VEVETILPDRTLVAAAPSQWPERAAAHAPEAAAPEPPRVPVEAEAGGIYLQLAAFSARDNAENFRARLALELAVLDRPAEVYGKDGLFRLHVGPYRSRAEANADAEKLKKALDLRAHIVVR